VCPINSLLPKILFLFWGGWIFLSEHLSCSDLVLPLGQGLLSTPAYSPVRDFCLLSRLVLVFDSHVQNPDFSSCSRSGAPGRWFSPSLNFSCVIDARRWICLARSFAAVCLVLSFRVSLGSGFSVYRYRFRRPSSGSAHATASVAPAIPNTGCMSPAWPMFGCVIVVFIEGSCRLIPGIVLKSSD
jgi:hypothetical protein